MNYPLRVILDILGLPEEQFPKMLRLTQELFADDDPDFQREGAEDDQAMAVIMDVITMFTGLNAERRENPTTDLATVIANGQIDGKPLEDMDTYGYYLIVATAGHDTTSNAVAGGMQALLENKSEWDKLTADPSLIDGAADEIVRWVSPVKHFMRTAQQDYTLASGATINKGDWVLLSYQSANRDERVFTDPFTFDVTRADADKHLGFGFGRHYCLGAHLARLEIRAIFKELVGPARHHRPGGPHRAHRLGAGERPQADAGDLQLQELSPGRSAPAAPDRTGRHLACTCTRDVDQLRERGPSRLRPARRRTGSGWPRTTRRPAHRRRAAWPARGCASRGSATADRRRGPCRTAPTARSARSS